MRQLDLCKSFVDGYEQIKKNVGLYRQPESGEVSDLCEGFSYARSKPNPIVVLDIELSLKRDPKVKVQAQDRIDLTLFNTKKKAIRFFEVKTFGNGEIWPKPKGNPKVMQQVSRYVKQATSNNEMLLASYKQYVRVTNELFGQSYQAPENVEENVDLLVFDFDHNQRRQIKETLIPLFNSKFRCSFRGHAKGATNSTLSKWWNKK